MAETKVFSFPEGNGGNTVVYCDEARKLLGGVSYMTLSRWDKTGYLPKHHVGKRVVYRRVDIMNLLKKGGEE